jgi:hypothetical protein
MDKPRYPALLRNSGKDFFSTEMITGIVTKKAEQLA